MQLTLDKINFPVYVLGNKPDSDNGVIKYTKQYLQDEKLHLVEYIVDDKNIKAPTLGARRAQLASNNQNLYKINKSIHFIGDLIKVAKSGLWLIDSEGQLFEYKKTTVVPLIFRPIVSVQKLKSGGAIIEAQGVSSRFKSLFPPLANQKYVGLLVVGVGHILYGFYDQQYDRTTRHV